MEPTSPEPSMEDILASIKRIIAEEPPVADSSKSLKPGRQPITFGDTEAPVEADAASDEAAAPSAGGAGEDAAAGDVLELTSAVNETPQPAPSPPAAPAATAPTLVSDGAAIASRQALAALSAMVVKPEQGGDNTLEGLVREMLRPVLKEWLDARLPDIVERLVALEISRITSRGV